MFLGTSVVPVRNWHHVEGMMATYKELRAKAEELLRQADLALIEERREAIVKAKAIINEYELTATDLGLIKTQVIAAKKVSKMKKTFAVKTPKGVKPPKYRDPATGTTWSGYGHQPHWIVGNRDEYLIEREKPKSLKVA
jgi:DNA-binding protein H-NS